MKGIKAKVLKVSLHEISTDSGLELSPQTVKRLKSAQKISTKKLVTLDDFTKKYGKN